MERRYALDLASPVSFVATALETAAPAAVSLSGLVRDYHHVSSSDYVRIMHHEGCATEADAKRWLIRAAVRELGRHVRTEADPGDLRGEQYTLLSDFDSIRVDRRKIHRYVISDPELDRERAVNAAYAALREGYPVHLKVQGARGKVTERRVALHPLARKLPLMSQEDFVALVVDVAERGLQTPLYLYEDQVLDGRHRAWVASVLDLVVQVTVFTGTEKQARDHVLSLNAHRRHLTPVQRALIVRELFMADAAAEARERQGERTDLTADVRESSEAEEAPKKRGKTAAQIAAEMSGGLATPRTVETLSPIDDAPLTRERVRNNEITTAAQARREALAETGGEEPVKPPRSMTGDQSAWSRLGSAVTLVDLAYELMESGRFGTAPVARHRDRVNEMRRTLDKYEAALPNDETASE